MFAVTAEWTLDYLCDSIDPSKAHGSFHQLGMGNVAHVSGIKNDVVYSIWGGGRGVSLEGCLIVDSSTISI